MLVTLHNYDDGVIMPLTTLFQVANNVPSYGACVQTMKMKMIVMMVVTEVFRAQAY